MLCSPRLLHLLCLLHLLGLLLCFCASSSVMLRVPAVGRALAAAAKVSMAPSSGGKLGTLYAPIQGV